MHHFSQAANKTSGLFKSMSGKLRAACVVGAMTVLAASNAAAVPATYTFHWDNISGTLAGQAITGPLTITYSADTDALHVYNNNVGMMAYAAPDL